MTAVLADTGPLYALADPSDQYHHRAHREVARLANEALSVTVAYPVLLEAYTLVLRRLGVTYALGWVEEVVEGSTLLNPRQADYREATQLIRRYPDQSITLFDATLAKLASQLGLPIWTYDYHFDVVGAQIWR